MLAFSGAQCREVDKQAWNDDDDMEWSGNDGEAIKPNHVPE